MHRANLGEVLEDIVGMPVEIGPIGLNSRPGERLGIHLVRGLAAARHFPGLVTGALAVSQQESQIVALAPLPVGLCKEAGNLLLLILEHVAVRAHLRKFPGNPHCAFQQ